MCYLTKHGIRTQEVTCPQWDSNPHLADFKSAASANWAIGANPPTPEVAR